MLVTGPNGVGKSTLLRALAGLSRPANGAVRFLTDGGPPIPDEVGRHIHYLGHRDAVKPALTVGENLAFWRDFLGADGGAPVETALDRVGLLDLACPAGCLSLGGTAAAPRHCPIHRGAPAALAARRTDRRAGCRIERRALSISWPLISKRVAPSSRGDPPCHPALPALARFASSLGRWPDVPARDALYVRELRLCPSVSARARDDGCAVLSDRGDDLSLRHRAGPQPFCRVSGRPSFGSGRLLATLLGLDRLVRKPIATMEPST